MGKFPDGVRWHDAIPCVSVLIIPIFVEIGIKKLHMLPDFVQCCVAALAVYSACWFMGNLSQKNWSVEDRMSALVVSIIAGCLFLFGGYFLVFMAASFWFLAKSDER